MLSVQSEQVRPTRPIEIYDDYPNQQHGNGQGNGDGPKDRKTSSDETRLIFVPVKKGGV